MTLQERAETTLEIEYPSQSTLEGALNEAQDRLFDTVEYIRYLQEQIEKLQNSLFFAQDDAARQEGNVNLFINALNETDTDSIK